MCSWVAVLYSTSSFIHIHLSIIQNFLFYSCLLEFNFFYYIKHNLITFCKTPYSLKIKKDKRCNLHQNFYIHLILNHRHMHCNCANPLSLTAVSLELLMAELCNTRTFSSYDSLQLLIVCSHPNCFSASFTRSNKIVSLELNSCCSIFCTPISLNLACRL